MLLNNELDDFSAKPGNGKCLWSDRRQRHAIAGGKRPLSSMSPTLVFKNGEFLLATGSPGGSRIITTTLQIILNVIDHEMNIAEATAAPRMHHQWQPDEIRIETGLSPDTLALLEGLGHKLVVRNAMGATQSIMKKGGPARRRLRSARPGALTAGY